MVCKNCGYPLNPENKFCPKCGAKIESMPGAQSRPVTPETEVINTPLQQNYPIWQAAPSYTAPYNVPPMYARANKSVASCAWFGALSSAIVSFLAYLANWLLVYEVYYFVCDVSGKWEIAELVAYCILFVILEVVYFLICLGLFYAATSKIEKTIRKKAAYTAFIPMFFNLFFAQVNPLRRFGDVDEWVGALIIGAVAFAFSWLFSYIALKRFDTSKVR